MSAKIDYATGSSLRRPGELARLLLPSWLSAVLILALSLGLVGAVVGGVNYRRSSLPQLIQFQHQQTSTIQDNYQTLNDNLNTNTIVSDLPLLIFWAGVGLVVYEFITAIISGLGEAREFSEELGYVHANRRSMLGRVGLHLVIRVTALLLWFLFLRYSKDVLLPFILAVAYASTGPVGWLGGIGYFAGAVAVMVLGLHLHTILLRLVALRIRLF